MRAASLPAVLLLASAAHAAPDFDKQVAPVLAARCAACHAGDDPKGGLDLTRRAEVVGAGKAVVPGKLADSPLWQRVETGEMPPKGALTAAEKAVLKEWVAEGARWGTDPLDPFAFTSSTRAGRDWWSLQPIRRPPVPQIAAKKHAVRNDIDRFILAKLPDKWEPAPPTDRRTLVRRLVYDLHDLPPTYEQIEAFAADPRATALRTADGIGG
ncbi:DUF1549 domain-containing protein [bacterium]|nr:DUF1549 domain-containing protein [bacterium]